MTPRLQRMVALFVVVAAVATGCSRGGSSGDDDVAAPDQASTAAGDHAVQFLGAGKVRLVGTLSLPATKAGESVPAALIVPTAGTGDLLGHPEQTGVSDPLGRDMADAFTNAGLATYRYDQRGTGQSRIDPDVRLRLDDLVADARGALDLLAERKETAGRPLSVVGYDQGGLIALRLAAVDDRVKRVILIATPGRSLVDQRAAQMAERYGSESTTAMRALVADLLATRTLPPADTMRTELRSLFPTQEAPFLAELYGIDPVAEAARVKVPTMIVVPSDMVPYEPQRLAAAIPGAQVVTSAADTTTLVLPGNPVQEASDPNSPQHEHRIGPPVPSTAHDPVALETMARFLAVATGP